jgi:hypothetical protein
MRAPICASDKSFRLDIEPPSKRPRIERTSVPGSENDNDNRNDDDGDNDDGDNDDEEIVYTPDPGAVELYRADYESSKWKSDKKLLTFLFRHIERMWSGCPVSWYLHERHTPGLPYHSPLACPLLGNKQPIRIFHLPKTTGRRFCYSCRLPDRWDGRYGHCPVKTDMKEQCGPYTQYVRILLILVWKHERAKVLAAMSVIDAESQGVKTLEAFALWSMGLCSAVNHFEICHAVVLLAMFFREI